MENKRYEMALHACRTVPYYRKKIEQNPVLLKDLENRRGWEKLWQERLVLIHAKENT